VIDRLINLSIPLPTSKINFCLRAMSQIQPSFKTLYNSYLGPSGYGFEEKVRKRSCHTSTDSTSAKLLKIPISFLTA
jgi:hypothetical protein